MRAVQCPKCKKWITAADTYCRYCKYSWMPSPLYKCGFGVDNCHCSSSKAEARKDKENE